MTKKMALLSIIAIFLVFLLIPSVALAEESAEENNYLLESIFTMNFFNNLFDDIYSLIPLIMPVSVSYIGLRKAIKFVMEFLREA